MEKTKCATMFHRDQKHILLCLIGIFLTTIIISTCVDIYNKLAVPSENQIYVYGTGEVYAKPDLALSTLSVITEAKTVDEAVSKNAEDMNEIIKLVKSQGVEEKDIKTTSFNIYPLYEYEDGGTYYSGKRTLVGYEVSQSLEVKIRDLEKVGEIVQGATEAGANQVGSLQFTIDKQEEFENQAREEAITEAKEKAKELASQLGVKLVRITNFSESNSASYRYGLGGGEESASKNSSSIVPEFQTGENKIEVSVTITYEIR